MLSEAMVVNDVVDVCCVQYRSSIAGVEELKQRLVTECANLDHRIISEADGQWRARSRPNPNPFHLTFVYCFIAHGVHAMCTCMC